VVNPETLECVQPSCPLLPRCPSQGFPEKPAGFFNTDKLSLAAVGMRRKNFMVVEVDVYLVALSLSPSALLATKNWKKAQLRAWQDEQVAKYQALWKAHQAGVERDPMHFG
jgi:hypothetical protein